LLVPTFSAGEINMTKFNINQMSFDHDAQKFEFVMVGPIMVQARPKITYRSRNQPVYYDPSHNDKKLWKSTLSKEIKLRQLIVTLPLFHVDPFVNHGLHLHVMFVEKRPKLDFDKKGLLKVDHHNYPYQRDVDNMVKFIMDAMLGVIYKDDSCVVKVTSEKTYLSSNEMENHSPELEEIIVTVIKP
jgi:Endodeoxyribonuclease RusA